MRNTKAHGLVDTIIATHVSAIRVTHPDAVAALQNARLDLHGLVDQIIAECKSENAGDFNADADEAVKLTRES